MDDMDHYEVGFVAFLEEPAAVVPPTIILMSPIDGLGTSFSRCGAYS